ncbi:hypothetical protein [Halorussus ruber]|uniref:hypothetical protein n=1 Tax=Halorussus ruber TaxID=1126238 RepID=UPI001092660F|nr:hypothetical protein [Halorussus ruber]
MVGPPSAEEKRDSMNRLKVGIVVIVGLSAGLITMSGGGSMMEVAIAVVAGSLVGAALLGYLVYIT